jgi:hypothetical protein
VALADEVISRYSAGYLAGITNPQDAYASAYDATRLGKACTDVQAEFDKIGLLFDVTVASHVVTAVEGVIALLKKRTAQSGGFEEWKEWRDVQLERLRMVTTNDRIVPSSTSKLTPSDENPNNDTFTRPDFDKQSFDNLIPDQRGKSTWPDYTSDA